MEWTKNKKETKSGFRVINRFLFFPRTIGSRVKWLCFSKIKQIYSPSIFGSDWEDLYFIDNKKTF